MGRGGRRAGAGRPTGTGKFGETTVPIRVPLSKLERVKAVLGCGNDGFCRCDGTCLMRTKTTVTDDLIIIDEWGPISPAMYERMMQHVDPCARCQGRSCAQSGISDDLVILKPPARRVVLAQNFGMLYEHGACTKLLPLSEAKQILAELNEPCVHCKGPCGNIACPKLMVAK